MKASADLEDASGTPNENNNTIKYYEFTEDDCVYNLCTKSTVCYGKLPWGKFKNRTHSMFCSIICLMCVALVTAVIFPLVIYRMVDDGIDEQVVMDSTSNPNYQSFLTNTYGDGFEDIKITYSVYLFDLQNPDGVLRGEQPFVNEMGPYVYDEYFNKFDVEWFDDGDTIAYNTQKFYVFNQEKSGVGLTEEDLITLPYPSVIGFQYLLDQLPPEINMMLDAMIDERLVGRQQNLTRTISVLYDAVEESSLTRAQKRLLENKLQTVNESQQIIFANLRNLVATSDTGDILLKSLLCNIPSGISPFFQQTPSKAWFGWLNDPLMVEVQGIINVISSRTGQVIPWTTAIPGAASNYTSIEDARRRRNRDIYKTGKKNRNQVGQYVRYQNMTSMYTCISSTTASNPWNEGTEFPACPYFQYEWTEEEAAAHGYTKPFATDYAVGIRGTDANMFGRPVRSKKLQVFVSDIYRSVYMEQKGLIDWQGVTLRVYGIQDKDMLNATNNPENAQYYAFGYNGVENATKANSIPIYVSFPHYLNADAELQKSIKGLHPNEDIHSTWLAIEPQTGLLAKAHKRLQVNYYMEKYTLPTIDENSIVLAETLCADLQNVVDILGPIVNTTLPDISCNLTIITPLFTCLSMPSDWQVMDKLYMPYGWVSEDMELPDSSAQSLNDDLFAMEEVADSARFWCLVIAGVCFCVLMVMIVQMYQAASHSPQLAKWTYSSSAPAAGDDYNPVVAGVQPLLGEHNG